MKRGDKYIPDEMWFEYWEKSDAQLWVLYNDASTTLLVGNPGISEKMDAQKQYDAAVAVMEAKKARGAAELQALEKRHKTRKELLGKLRAAHTPNGQLVAAILEDEVALTKESIAVWCSELAELSPEEMDQLLDDLVEDGVISLDGDVYSLERICNETLAFEDDSFGDSRSFELWAVKKAVIAREANKYQEMVSKNGQVETFPIWVSQKTDEIVDDIMDMKDVWTIYKVISAIHFERCGKKLYDGMPYSQEDIVKHLRESIYEIPYKDAMRNLAILQSYGILTSITANGETFYAVPFLGEK